MAENFLTRHKDYSSRMKTEPAILQPTTPASKTLADLNSGKIHIYTLRRPKSHIRSQTNMTNVRRPNTSAEPAFDRPTPSFFKGMHTDTENIIALQNPTSTSLGCSPRNASQDAQKIEAHIRPITTQPKDRSQFRPNYKFQPDIVTEEYFDEGSKMTFAHGSSGGRTPKYGESPQFKHSPRLAKSGFAWGPESSNKASPRDSVGNLFRKKEGRGHVSTVDSNDPEKYETSGPNVGTCSSTHYYLKKLAMKMQKSVVKSRQYLSKSEDFFGLEPKELEKVKQGNFSI
jgi:hypothetical protein